MNAGKNLNEDTGGGSGLNVELGSILSNVLWFYCKWDDAPMSAQTHLDQAIVDLVALCPDFTPATEEIAEIITNATEHMRVLGYVPNYN
ncbi:MAG: hypothetical protein ACU841_12450 [Gammaproteobacteria bacterium]